MLVLSLLFFIIIIIRTHILNLHLRSTVLLPLVHLVPSRLHSPLPLAGWLVAELEVRWGNFSASHLWSTLCTGIFWCKCLDLEGLCMHDCTTGCPAAAHRTPSQRHCHSRGWTDNRLNSAAYLDEVWLLVAVLTRQLFESAAPAQTIP